MFDKHIYKGGDNVTQRVTENINITENRAPTDESLRLLKEYREKATQSVIDEIKIENNIVNGCILVLCHEHNTMGISVWVHIKFNLNGITFNSKKEFQENDLFHVKHVENVYQRHSKLFQFFYEEVSKKITEQLFENNQEEIKKFIVSH